MLSRPRFSIRTLFIATGLLALLLSCVAVPLLRLGTRLRTIRYHNHAIVHRYRAAYSESELAGPKWLRRFLPSSDYYIKLGEVCLMEPFHTNETIGDLVPHLNAFDNFHKLGLYSDIAAITDDGLSHLKSLKGLDELSLSGNGFTDASVSYLVDLHTLRKLHFQNTLITPAAAVKLKASLPQCEFFPDLTLHAVALQANETTTSDLGPIVD